jgi:hypothetical protein
VDLSHARVVWEAAGQEPVFARELAISRSKIGQQWLEVEAQLPDGRRVFAVTNAAAIR